MIFLEKPGTDDDGHCDDYGDNYCDYNFDEKQAECLVLKFCPLGVGLK